MKKYLEQLKDKNVEPKNDLGYLTKTVLSFNEALALLDVSSSMLYKLTHKRVITFYKPSNGKLFFKREDLLNWMLSNQQPSQEFLENDINNYLNRNKNGKK